MARPSHPRARRAADSSRTAATRLALASLSASFFAAAPAAAAEYQMVVTVTAYNSVPEQTDDEPRTAAWGDELEPGMRAIAVSRDLLDIGLRRGSKVRIEGLPGEYLVLDKMHWRWSESIDLYMGEDVPAARRFGRQRRTVTFEAPDWHHPRPALPAAPAAPLDAPADPAQLEASRQAGEDTLPAVSAAPLPAGGAAPTPADFAPALLETKAD